MTKSTNSSGNSGKWRKPAELAIHRRDGDSPKRNKLTGVLVGLATAGLLLPVAFRGWIPHDEGTLGKSAMGILNGEWPHADFLDVYPGLLGVIHAGAFTALGESIWSLRIVWLIVAAVGAVSAFILLRHRLSSFISALAAIGLTVLAYVVYPASMPTWWNVSLGVTATALAYSGWKMSSRRLMFSAGLVTGVSILIKTTGGAFVAIAIFCWLVSVREIRARWLGVASYVTALVTVIGLVAPGVSVGRVVLLGIPATIALGFAWFRSNSIPSGLEIRERSEHALWTYASGVALLPVMVVALYAFTGRLNALLTGWVSSPALRFDSAANDIPFSPSVLILGVLGWLVFFVSQRSQINVRVVGVGILGALALWEILDWSDFGRIFFAIVAWSALSLALGLLWWRSRIRRDQLTVLVTLVALMFILIQIPVWNGYYAAYSLPFLGLSLLLIVPRGRVMITAMICLTAAVFLTQSISGRLVGPMALDEPITYVALDNPRARISVPTFDAYYDELAEHVASVAGGHPVYAGPDAPEVAFLAGVEPATPAFFEVLDLNWDYQVIADLAASGSAVVVNTSPDFSPEIPESVMAQVRQVNESDHEVGKFIITWSSR